MVFFDRVKLSDCMGEHLMYETVLKLKGKSALLQNLGSSLSTQIFFPSLSFPHTQFLPLFTNKCLEKVRKTFAWLKLQLDFDMEKRNDKDRYKQVTLSVCSVLPSLPLCLVTENIDCIVLHQPGSKQCAVCPINHPSHGRAPIVNRGHPIPLLILTLQSWLVQTCAQPTA